MDETLTGDEVFDTSNNELPDLIEKVPEPSLVTENGLKYYAEDDVTSWLNGFNVLVLKLDEIITEQNRRISELESTVSNQAEIINEYYNM